MDSLVFVYIVMDCYYLHIRRRREYEKKEIAVPLWQVQKYFLQGPG